MRTPKIKMEELHKNNRSLTRPIRQLMQQVKEELVKMMFSKLLTVPLIKLDKGIRMTIPIIHKEIGLKNLMVVSLLQLILVYNVELLNPNSDQSHIKQQTGSHFHSSSPPVLPRTTWTKPKISLAMT